MTKLGDTDDPELEAVIKQYQAKAKKVRAELATITGLQYRKTSGPHYLVALDGKIIGYVDWLAKRNGKVVQWQPKIALGMERLGACLTVRTAADAVGMAWKAYVADHPDSPLIGLDF